MNTMKIYLLKIFIIAANQFVSSLTVVKEQSDYNTVTVDCIVQATHFVSKRKVAVEFVEEQGELASEILKKIEVPVVLNTVERRNPSGVESRTFNDVTLLLKNVEAEKILNDTLWNGETRFLVLVTSEKEMEKYFERFWKLKVINVFGMVLRKGDVPLYSFLPYRVQDCRISELIIVDTCSKGKLRGGGRALVDPIRIKNMNGCPVNISVTDARPNVIFEPDGGRNVASRIEGFEGNLMAEVAKIYNFKTSFKLPEDGIGWGWIHPSPHGVVGEVYLGVSDMCVGMLGPFPERYHNLDLSSNYNMDECVTFAVPQGYGAKKSSWISIFVLEFNLYTWLLIMFSFLLIGINMWLINKYLDANWFTSKTEIALLLFSSCLGAPVNTPQPSSAKTSVIFWIIYTFIATVAYKTSMGSKLAVPPQDPDINTIPELLNSDLELTGLKNMNQLLTSSDQWTFKALRKKYHFTNDSIEDVVMRMANRDKIAHLRHRSSFYYYSLNNPRARGRIHVIKDCILLYHPYVMLKKFSPFTKRVSQIVRRLEESGIMAIWRAEYNKNIPPPSKPFFKLSIDQMSGVFYFLLLGYLTSLVSFLGELLIIYGSIRLQEGRSSKPVCRTKGGGHIGKTLKF